MNLSEDRGQILKIEDSPLKNQADGQPSYNSKCAFQWKSDEEPRKMFIL